MLRRIAATGVGCLPVLAAGAAMAAPGGPAVAGLPPFDCSGPFARDASATALANRFGAGKVVFRTVPGPVRLVPTPGAPADDVDGDRDFRSAAPAMRAAQSLVYEMMLLLE